MTESSQSTDRVTPNEQPENSTGKKSIGIFSIRELKTFEDASAFYAHASVFCVGTTDKNRYFASVFEDTVAFVSRSLFDDTAFKTLTAEKKRRLQSEPPVQIPYLKRSAEFLKWYESAKLKPCEDD